MITGFLAFPVLNWGLRISRIRQIKNTHINTIVRLIQPNSTKTMQYMKFPKPLVLPFCGRDNDFRAVTGRSDSNINWFFVWFFGRAMMRFMGQRSGDQWHSYDIGYLIVILNSLKRKKVKLSVIIWWSTGPHHFTVDTWQKHGKIHSLPPLITDIEIAQNLRVVSWHDIDCPKSSLTHVVELILLVVLV